MWMLRRRRKMMMLRRKTNPKTGKHTESKRTWTFHKSHFVWKCTGKMPDAYENTSIKHRASTLTVRTPQCGHTVWGKITINPPPTGHLEQERKSNMSIVTCFGNTIWKKFAHKGLAGYGSMDNSGGAYACFMHMYIYIYIYIDR